MNPRFRILAEEAGFVFWQDEPHGPGPGNIDWSHDYKHEFERYSSELVRWTIKRCEDNMLIEKLAKTKRDWIQQTLDEFSLVKKIQS